MENARLGRGRRGDSAGMDEASPFYADAAPSANIRDALALLAERDQVVELRILGGRKGTVSGYFNDHDALGKAALAWSGKAAGIYVTLNPVNPELLARAYNRIEIYAKHTTNDVDILKRRWLAVDFDAKRPAGISSTDAKHEAALSRARDCRKWLRSQGWPDPIYADSGNGGHLLYRIELPNDENVRALVERCLKALAARFDDEAVSIDPSVFNAARIWKCYGTLVCKGDSLSDRPHRTAQILETPESLAIVSAEQLRALAATLPEESPRPQSRPNPSINGEDFFRRVNGTAMERLQIWVPQLFPQARAYKDGYRVRSTDLGRDREEDLSILPSGIKDFGEHDMGDSRSGKRTPIDLVMDWHGGDATEAAHWLCGQCGIAPESIGWHARRSDNANQYQKDKPATDGKPQGTDAKPPRKSQATELVEIAETADLFHDRESTAYVTLHVGQRCENWPIRSRGFRDWLCRRYWLAHKKAPSSQALTDALGVIEGHALFEGVEHPVHLRIASHDAKIYLDLCDHHWRCVMIDAHGWEITDKPPVRFIRRKGMLQLPEPAGKGNLSMLWNFVNLDDSEARILLSAWLIQALRPKGPYPVLILQGEQGTAKSTLQRVLRALIDPSLAPLRTAPRDERDLLITARNGHVIALDNLSGVSPWLSDALCRIATGGGFSTRELFTDVEEILIDVQRPVMLNGIDDIASRQDLIDRAIILNLDPISDHKRRDEAEFWASFEKTQSVILGALLDAVATALKNFPHTRLERLPRMADFALWATAAEPAIGVGGVRFTDAYSTHRQEAVEAGLEGSPVATALRQFMADRISWEGTSTQLLARLEDRIDESMRRFRSWPKSAKSLSSQLRRLATGLRAIGLNMCFQHSGNRTIRIDWIGKFASNASMRPDSNEDKDLDWTQRGRNVDATAKPHEASSDADLDATDATDAKLRDISSGDSPENDDMEEFML